MDTGTVNHVWIASRKQEASALYVFNMSMLDKQLRRLLNERKIFCVLQNALSHLHDGPMDEHTYVHAGYYQGITCDGTFS